MSFAQKQITIGGSATAVSATSVLVREVIFEPESSSSHVMAIGGSTATILTGFNIEHATANIPMEFRLGPFEVGVLDLKDFYVIGTAAEICNVHYVLW